MKYHSASGENRIHLTASGSETENFRREDRHHEKGLSVIGILVTAIVFALIASLLLIVPYQQFHMTPAWFFEHIRTRFAALYEFLFADDSYNFGISVYQYIAVVFVGGALAATGAIFQGSMRNTLAGPSTMGVMSGGSAGCMLYLLLFTESTSGAVAVQTTADLSAYYSQTFVQTYLSQFCVLAGCFIGVGLVLAVATAAGRGRLSARAMILSGTVFSHLISSVTMMVQYYIILTDPDDTRLEVMQDMMMGTFNNITDLRTMLMLVIPLMICCGVIIALCGRLNLLSLGETEAMAMGVNVRAWRYLMIVLGTVLTAVVVAFCGHIGFLGFMVPLVGRKLVGPDMKKLVPVSILLGSLLLLLVYDAAYIAGMTDYLNMFTSILGSIVMIVTLLSGKGGRQDAVIQARAPLGMGMR